MSETHLPPGPGPWPGPAPGPGPGAVVVAETKSGPGLLVRALWFVVVGWWLTGIVSLVAWAAMVTIIGLPLGIWLVNRIPTTLTLRPRTSSVFQWVDASGQVRTAGVPIRQQPWWVRGLWFIVIGWWLSGIAMTVGLVLCVLIITMPIGLMLYNRVPFAASLYRY
jgi:uncharacterized membrane protein YccF (DUF307 family)